jgi:hypothetical protein
MTVQAARSALVTVRETEREEMAAPYAASRAGCGRRFVVHDWIVTRAFHDYNF